MKKFLIGLMLMVGLISTISISTSHAQIVSTHSQLSGLDLHQAFHFEQSSDPGAVGIGKWWFETDTGKLWRRNADNTAWDEILIGGGGGGGSGDLTGVIGTSGQVVVSSGDGPIPQISLATPILDGSSRYCSDSGSTDDYACNLTPAPASYILGASYWFKANTANLTAATINFNALGAKTIKKAAGGVTTDLASNDIRSGQVVEVVYDGTNFQMQSVLGNASGGGGGSPGGDDTHVQFNDASSFGGDAGLVYNKATDILSSTGGVIAGNCATNCQTHDTSAVTGSKTVTWPNLSGTVPLSPNARKVVQIEVFGPGVTLTTGDGKAYFRIPTSLNGMTLVAVTGNVLTAGTTNATNIDIDRCVAAATGNVCSSTVADVLTTNLTIDSGENDSDTAAAPVVINTSNDDVSTGQLYRINVDAISTTPPQGLILNLEFSL